MTTKDFNLVYREFVSRQLIVSAEIALKGYGLRGTYQELAYCLDVEPNTVSRLARGCFNASPKVLLGLYAINDLCQMCPTPYYREVHKRVTELASQNRLSFFDVVKRDEEDV